ncbi:Mad3/BUB1 homology region 1-domain-containing protein [Phascolomyces articulosus]|uniref:Mad3/BUB1 homology region 1-domain-containing protein n=1 Tax=Phascolomyces articulosus TaxID=60185 RepID=A0AAD5K1I1_9FUNG|nr:Mad3/BUB1 homology region 1-domain-containing protein [Phascolomyces articulosus]
MDDEERQTILNNLPEFSVIEGQKENVMPRRQGRSAASLATLYSSTCQEREHQLQQGHDQFARELEDIEDMHDPLDVYLRYIHWTIEMYPEGHNQASDLKGLLQETTSKFQRSKRYQHDIRYLKVWIQYMEYLDDPGEAYQLLMRNQIGQDLALFYEEYASYLEGRKRYEDATLIYDRGLERMAEPTKRLARKRKHFLDRMDQQHQEQQRNASLAATNGRAPLGMKYDSLFSASSSSSFSSRSPSSISTPSSSRQAQFSVYSGPEIDSTPVPSSSTSSSTLVNNPSQRAENQIEVSSFAGTTLPQKPYRRPKQQPGFSVFRDDDPSNQEDEPQPQHTINTTLSADSHRTTTKIPSEHLYERFNICRSDYIKSKDSRGRTEIIAASKACINKSNNNELMSFEELHHQFMQKMDQFSNSRLASTSLSAKDTLSLSLNEPPTELTQETRAATNMIDDMIFGASGTNGTGQRGNDELVLDDDDDEPLSFTHNNIKRNYTDENAISNRSLSRMEISRQGSSGFFDQMDTLEGSDVDDLENIRGVPQKRTYPY